MKSWERRTIRTAELFCGAGLMGGGFARQGFEPVFAADLDARCIESYNRNVASVAMVWDISKIKRDVRCDVLVAGPPCQGFSTLGRRDNSDERNRLSLLVADWAMACRASVIVVENVPQFLESSYWNILVTKFKRMGYASTAWMLDAYDYGVAQRRTRSFTVLSRIGLPKAPAPSCKKLSVKDAFKNIPCRSVDCMHAVPKPSEIALERFKRIPPKGDKRDIMRRSPALCPRSWFELGAQATDVWGRMSYDRPANTVRCCFQNPSKGRYIHPTENRVITLREGARLQGVPDDWSFAGDRTSIARQIGNGVPVPLAEAVARSVKSLFM